MQSTKAKNSNAKHIILIDLRLDSNFFHNDHNYDDGDGTQTYLLNKADCRGGENNYSLSLSLSLSANDDGYSPGKLLIIDY